MTTESDLPDGWRLTGDWRYSDGRVRLELATLVPPPGRDTIGGLKAMSRRLGAAWIGDEWEHVFRSHVIDLPHEWVQGFAESPRPGRAGHPDEFYALWVRRYLDAVAEHGERGQPVAALVAQYKGETKQSINRYVREAEKRELIRDRPGRGRAGGAMTDECKRLLDLKEGN